jgi:hypothetical protein
VVRAHPGNNFGRWDEVLRRAEAQIALGPHYTLDSMFNLKAYILAAREQPAAARACRDEAMMLTEKISDAQSAIPGLFESAWSEDLAFQLIRRVYPIAVGIRHRTPGVDAKNTVLIIRAGMAKEWLELHRQHADTRRVRAANLLLEGRVIEAADAWALVSPHDEAVARLEAARQLAPAGRLSEADVQLERGLAFFRAVGASKMVRDAEGLLSAAS